MTCCQFWARTWKKKKNWPEQPDSNCCFMHPKMWRQPITPRIDVHESSKLSSYLVPWSFFSFELGGTAWELRTCAFENKIMHTLCKFAERTLQAGSIHISFKNALVKLYKWLQCILLCFGKLSSSINLIPLSHGHFAGPRTDSLSTKRPSSVAVQAVSMAIESIVYWANGAPLNSTEILKAFERRRRALSDAEHSQQRAEQWN